MPPKPVCRATFHKVHRWQGFRNKLFCITQSELTLKYHYRTAGIHRSSIRFRQSLNACPIDTSLRSSSNTAGQVVLDQDVWHRKHKTPALLELHVEAFIVADFLVPLIARDYTGV
jgi:hypothetical protein